MSKKIKQSRVITDFIKVVQGARKDAVMSYAYRSSFDNDKILEWALCDLKRLKALVSNKYWIKYPSYVCSRSSPRPYGYLIFFLTKDLCNVSLEAKNILIDKSVGLFLSATLDNTCGKDMLRAAKRGVRSKDQRARLRASKIVPVSVLKKMMGDSSYAVRCAVIKRIGIANCADDLVTDSNYWIKREALINSTLSPIDGIERIRNEMTNSNDNGPLGGWSYSHILQELVARLPADEIPYHLDLSTISGELDRILRLKMQHHGGELNVKQGESGG